MKNGKSKRGEAASECRLGRREKKGNKKYSNLGSWHGQKGRWIKINKQRKRVNDQNIRPQPWSCNHLQHYTSLSAGHGGGPREDGCSRRQVPG